MPQRAVWCVSEYHRVLPLQREDADFIVLPSVTSVCVLGCLKASPTPPCLLPVFTTVESHVRVWPAALSTPQRSGEPVKKSRLIGQRLPWEELGDASLIYYTHTSQGNQRKGILLTWRITSSHASLSLFPFLSSRSHMPNASTKTHTHTHTHCSRIGLSEVLFIRVWHLGLLLFCIVSVLLTSFTPGSKWLISPPTGALDSIINRLALTLASGLSASVWAFMLLDLSYIIL